MKLIPTIPQIRSLCMTVASMATGAVLAIQVVTSHSVDMYAAWEHLHAAWKELAAAWTVAGPILIAAATVYLSRTGQKIKDASNAPDVVEVARNMTPTPQVKAMAEALKEAPPAAR